MTLMLAALLLLAQAPKEIFAADNLVAWCVVPFDAKKRGPAERVEMLAKLGFKRFAYDWRGPHLPTFDEEVGLLRMAGIELTAVWFPADLGADAKTLLGVIEKHKLKTQLWVMLGEPAGKSQDEKVANAAKTLKPIAEAAGKLGCSVGLYNHGGWAGEPENMVAVVKATGRDNVGIVYNLHHGHAHLRRLPEALAVMKPHLLCLNLNGMDPDGDTRGRKILPIGAGKSDADVMKAIRGSGYAGPVGVIGHTEDDAAERLADNLDGLRFLLRGGMSPKWRTWKPTPDR